MKKYLIAFVLSLVAFVANAKEDFYAMDKTNAFGYPDKELVKIIEAEPLAKSAVKVSPKPLCNDKKLTDKVRKTLVSYIDDGALKVADKRRNKLIVKNLDNFEHLAIDNDKSKMPRVVAAKLIELKINKHIGDENIMICKTTNQALRTNVYLFIYDDVDNGVVVDVVNLVSDTTPQFVWSDD